MMLKIAWYELKKLFRNKRWIILTILQPIILVTLLSLAAYHDPSGIKVIIFNKDKNQYSQKIIDAVENEKDFSIEEAESEETAVNKIKTNKAKVALIVDVKKEDEEILGKVESINNSTVPEISFFSKLKLTDILSDPIKEIARENFDLKLNKEISDEKSRLSEDQKDFSGKFALELNSQNIAVETQAKVLQALSNAQSKTDISIGNISNIPEIKIDIKDNSVKTLKYFDLYASALLIMITLMITLKISDTSITEERSLGTFERFFVTPYTKFHMILGKMMAYTFLDIFIVAILLITMITITHVSIGPLWLVFLLCFLTAISSASLGILISSLTYTVNESIQASNLLFFSSIIVTGFLFQAETMNKYIKYLTYAFPFTYSIKAMREINLLGMGIVDVWKDLVIVAAFTLGLLMLSIVALKRKAT